MARDNAQARRAPVRPALVVGVVLVATLAVHAGAIEAPFVWDDRPLILDSPLVQAAHPLWDYFARPFWSSPLDSEAARAFYRPIVTLSYRLDHLIAGDVPLAFHATNVLLAARGKDAQIRIPSFEPCEVCKGSGAKPGTSVKTCGTCSGSGAVQMRQGFFSVQQTCPTCRGTGKVIPEPCTACSGQGKVKKQKTLEVKIPAGIDGNMRIRSTGNGEPGANGGPPGDLYIEIRLKKHDIFERDGDDIHCSVPISIITASLGGEIEVPTLAGKAAIDIPEGTQTGKQFRLRGKGIKGVRASYPGDLYCHITVETPVKLSEHQRKLLKELDDSFQKGGNKHSPTGDSWTDRLKSFFS